MSAIQIEATATVSAEGVMKIDNRGRFDAEVKEFFAGKKVRIKVSKESTPASGGAKRYLFGVVYMDALKGFTWLGNYGLTTMDVHEFFKGQFLKGRDIIIDEQGNTCPVPATTKGMTQEDFWEYVRSIKHFCLHKLGVHVRDPYEEITSFSID